MENFVDDNGDSCFIDDNGVTSWEDDNGNVLSCIDAEVPAPVVVTQSRGKGKKQQIHSSGPWAYR
jgi:hypothetical protein